MYLVRVRTLRPGRYPGTLFSYFVESESNLYVFFLKTIFIIIIIIVNIFFPTFSHDDDLSKYRLVGEKKNRNLF